MNVSIPKPKVGIIVLNWNGKADTCQCLTSLQALQYPYLEIVIVDNGSTDDSVACFKQAFPTCTLLETGKNLGYAGGNNVGIEYGLQKGFDYFLILNNDTIVDPQVIDGFLEVFATHPQAGIVGGKIYLMSDPNRLDHLGGNWDPKTARFSFVGHHLVDDQKSFETPISLDYACGAAIMIRRAVFEQVGLFDPRFFLFWEEADLCFRARKAQFLVLSAPHAKVWHKVSASFVGGKPHTAYFDLRNRLLWIEKNCPRSESYRLRAKLIGLGLPYYAKQKTLTSLHFFLAKLLRKENISEKREKMRIYHARFQGLLDYLLRRFGPGSIHTLLKHNKK